MAARLHVRRFGLGSPLVALHGFTQTGAMFCELATFLGRSVTAPDLPGHGGSARVPATFQSAVDRVGRVLATFGHAVPLLGYSQGGRVALGVALARPSRISRLVLISAGAGLADPEDRARRRKHDEALARLLESAGLDGFLTHWLGLDMFAGLRRRGEAWAAVDRAGRSENTVGGLRAALLGMGQGIQPYLGDRLGGLPMPVIILAGERDESYLTTARWLAERIPFADLAVLPGCGHALVGEDPQAVAALVDAFLA